MLKRLGWLDGDTEISITGTGKNVMMRLTNEISGYQSKKASEVSPSENLYTDSVTNNSNQQNISISNLPTQDSAHNLHIMIVDDEPDVLVTYESFLSHAGYDVKAFVDSYQALKAFASEPMLYDSHNSGYTDGKSQWSAIISMHESNESIFKNNIYLGS